MAFEGDQASVANTLFPISQRHARLSIGYGSNGSVPFISIPNVGLQETGNGPYVPWSRSTHDDPNDLINCAQNHIKNGKPDVTDDAEMELQGLVANILGEADSQDSLFSDGSLGQRSKNIWSPKILRDELLQYFQSEANTQYTSNFAPNNYTSHDAFGKAQAVNKDTEKLCVPMSNGFNRNQLFNLPNGVHNSFSQPQKPPPGFTFPPNRAKTYLQLQANNYENGEERVNGENIGNFSDLSHGFRPQNDINGGELFYKDHYNQVPDKPAVIAKEQFASRDLNTLVGCFQSFLTSEREDGEFVNAPQRQDNMADKWESPNAFMQVSNGSPLMQRQLGQDFGSERSNGIRKQLFKREPLQDLSSYNLQSTEYSPEQKLLMGNHDKMIQRENTCRPFAKNHYLKHHVQQSAVNFKSQMQQERKRISGYFGDAFTARPPTHEVFSEEKQPALSQNHFYDLPMSARAQPFHRENVIPQQSTSLVYRNDQRVPSQIPNQTNFNPRGSRVYRGRVPSMDVPDAVVANEISGGFSPGLNGRRGESTYHGMSPTPAAQGGPVFQFHFHLDKCYEQWKSLEKERKKAEIVISKTFLGKLTTTFLNSSLPKTPPNPSRVDYLIAAQMREQALVSSLLDKMKCLSSVPLNANIYTALSDHHRAVCVTKEEILNMSHNQRQRVHVTEERDTMLLVTALKDLAATTQKLRTALWCALQTTLLKPVPRPQSPASQETQDEKDPAPSEGYSYSIKESLQSPLI